jgi:transposase
MLPQSATAPQSPQRLASPPSAPTRVGVGIDTSRYGHYGVFLREDLQPAAAELCFAESAAGYRQLRQQLEQIRARYPGVLFIIRVDAAGPYADNLLHFLYALAAPGTDPSPLASFACQISCGDPQRNKNYRAALFGSKKSDPIEARAAARYALSEQPAPLPARSLALRTLRQVAGRLQAVTRQRTRLINQFHHLLALSFPELALLVKDVSTGWVLELMHRYPTAQLLAQASVTDLENIPYLAHAQIPALLEQARTSVASLQGPSSAELVRDQVRQLRDVGARQKRLENLLVSTYNDLPDKNYLDSIPGIGPVTAAVLTAFMLQVDRFATPGHLVAYFGALPIQAASGVDRDGQVRAPRRYVMSPRGNDLVRRYLWMAALSAIRYNPAARALYARVVAKHPEQKAIAVGHVMRKLLHLVFAIWKTKKPFDPTHYPWQTPRHGAASVAAPVPPAPANNQAAGLTHPAEPVRKEVTAARLITSAPSIPEKPAGGEHATRDEPTAVDFAHLKRQLTMAQLADHLGLPLRGRGPQRRGPCPIHRGDGRGRTFSVHLNENVFHCFDAACGKKGDVIDLWASVKGMSLRAAAIDLVHTFSLEPTPPQGTEKRHG